MRWLLSLVLLCPQDPAADAWIRRLGDASPEVREKAEQAFLDVGDAALPALRKALDGSDAEIRARARRMIQRLEYGGTINPLLFSRYPQILPALEEGDPLKFLEACSRHPAANHLFAEGLEAYYIRLLDHPGVEVRRRATLEIWNPNRSRSMTPRRPIATLLGLLERWDPADDADGKWLQAIAEILFQLESVADRATLAAARAQLPEAEEILQILRADPKAILGAIDSKPGWKRNLAMSSAGKLQLQEARPSLLRALEHPESYWRAIDAFSRIAGPADREAFLEFLRKTPGRPWTSADILVLAKVEARETAPQLIGALALREQRESAARALADLGIRDAFDALCAHLKDPHYGNIIETSAARLATGETVGLLIDAGCTWGLRNVADPAARRVLLDRFDKEQRPKERKWLFEALRYSELGKTREGLDALEALARRPDDPLAFEASIQLLMRQGPPALPLAEAALAKAVNPHWQWVQVLRHYPSDRMVETMERMEELGYLEALGTPARDALGRIAARAKNPQIRHAAAGALAWIGGDAKEVLARALAERSANQEYGAPERFGDLLQADLPGFRDELRRQVKAQGVRPFLSLLGHWADPEMIPELRSLLIDTPKTKREKVATEDFFGATCGTGQAVDATGWQAVEALGATGDRSLIPYFLELLREPETQTQQIAIRVLGRWQAAEAVPALRQLLRSGDSATREEAARSLGQIGGPGVGDFLKQHLRDTPDETAQALARLGVDARAEIRAILAERHDDCRLLGALDLMASWKVYGNLDAPLPRRASRRVVEFPALLERLTGTRARLSAGVRKALEEQDLVWYDWKARTLREALDRMGQYSNTLRLGHVYREGAIEICTLAEAREFLTREK